jgi:hypothetical protein
MEVIERFAEPFWERYGASITVDQRKALQAILQCRTWALGGHRYDCECGHTHFAWHSCNNRLCPQCGTAANAEWVGKQLEKLLPVPYFLVTFTLPAELRPIALRKIEVIEAFFKQSGEALAEILADPKRTGFHKSGFFGAYQSWDQQLRFHPHIHYLVPGVGLSEANRPVFLKNTKFLVYAEPLAARFRNRFLNWLREKGFIDNALYWKLRKMEWVVDIEPPGNGENAFKYIGQYVHQSVISDKRILAIEGGHVRIRIKNRDTNQFETRRIEGVDFIHRFLLHALPSGFHRIRYRGFLHARARPALQWLQTALGARLRKREKAASPPKPTYHCPICGSPMRRAGKRPRAPPDERNEHFLDIVAA